MTTKTPTTAPTKAKARRDLLHFSVRRSDLHGGIDDFVPFGQRIDALEHAAEAGPDWKAVTVAKNQPYSEAIA